MSTGARRVLVAVLGLVPAVFTAASAAWWWDRLPASLPTHSDLLGRPDGFSARTATVVAVVALTAAGSLVVVGACAWSRPPVTARAAATGGCFATGLTAGTWVSIAVPTLLAPSAAEAGTGWWLLVLVASPGWALLARLLRVPPPALSGDRLSAHQDVPLRPVAPGERVGWSTVIGPTWLTWAVAGLLVLQVAVAVALPAAAPAVVVAGATASPSGAAPWCCAAGRPWWSPRWTGAASPRPWGTPPSRPACSTAWPPPDSPADPGRPAGRARGAVGAQRALRAC